MQNDIYIYIYAVRNKISGDKHMQNDFTQEKMSK